MRVTLPFLSDLCLEFHRKGAEREEGAQEAVLGRGAEANNCKKKKWKEFGGRFHFKLLVALQESPPVVS